MATYEGELRRFPSRGSATPVGRARFHAVLEPHLQPQGAQAVTREVSATGADGELVGILRYTGRPFRFDALAGCASEAELAALEQWLNEIDGRVGELEINRGSVVRVMTVQVYGVARASRMRYATVDGDWPMHVRYRATMREVL